MKDLAIRALCQIEASAKNDIWDAHRGFAAIAAAFLVSQGLVSREAKPTAEGQARALLNSEEYTPDTASPIARSTFATKILHEISLGAKEPKALGHDVIFSAYVLRALSEFDIDPWVSLLDGLTDLIRKFKSSGPGWITVNGRNEVRTPLVADEKIQSGYWIIFSQFDRAQPMEIGDMQLGHLLTHGHSIEMLAPYGTEALAGDLDIAFRKRVNCLRTANGEQLINTPLRRGHLDPRTKQYWDLAAKYGNMHGHSFKYAYSFLDLKRDNISNRDIETFSRIMWPEQGSLL